MLYSLPTEFTEPKPKLAYWEKFLSDEQLNYLLNLPEWKSASPAAVLSGQGSELIQDVRASKTSWLAPTERNLDIFEAISLVVDKVNKDYFGFDLTGFYEPLQLTLYDEENSGHYTWHVDAGYGGKAKSSSYRKLSMTLLLNDPSEFEGGDLYINDGTNGTEGVKLEQAQGRAWFFPSYCLHKVTPVTKGTRKTVVLWVGGPAFR